MMGFLNGGSWTFDVTGPTPFVVDDPVGLGVAFANNSNGTGMMVGVGTPGVNFQYAHSFYLGSPGQGGCIW